MGARSGNNYLSALRKLKAEIWLGGERVADVTQHPAFMPLRPLDRLALRPADRASRGDDVSHRRGRSGRLFVHAARERRRSPQARPDDEPMGGIQRRDARPHARLPQRERRRDGGGAPILRRERSAFRRQCRQLLSRSAPPRLVRDPYAGESARQPRRRMGRQYRRRPRAASSSTAPTTESWSADAACWRRWRRSPRSCWFSPRPCSRPNRRRSSSRSRSRFPATHRDSSSCAATRSMRPVPL